MEYFIAIIIILHLSLNVDNRGVVGFAGKSRYIAFVILFSISAFAYMLGSDTPEYYNFYTHLPSLNSLTRKNLGMNDRFLTLLNKLGLEDRIATSIAEAELVFNREINFKKIDNALENYQKVGVEYIKRELSM